VRTKFKSLREAELEQTAPHNSPGRYPEVQLPNSAENLDNKLETCGLAIAPTPRTNFSRDAAALAV
jgi:hypothetical protein